MDEEQFFGYRLLALIGCSCRDVGESDLNQYSLITSEKYVLLEIPYCYM